MALNVFQKCLFQANVFQTDVCGESPIPPSGGGGGGYGHHKPGRDDAEEIFTMMVNAFMRIQ